MITGLVSVIVPMYNSEQVIDETVKSILNQTYSNIEIILVNDGSVDRTSEICANITSLHKNVYYYYKQNGGVASARNYGINKSKGEFVAICDHDDNWISDKIEIQLNYFYNETIGLVYGKANGVKYTGKCYRDLLLFNCIPASSVIVRRCCFDEVGLFDERREMSGVDDKHMWVRIATKYPICCVDKNLFEWGVSSTNYSKQQDKMLKAELCCADDIISKRSIILNEHDCSQTYFNIYNHYANNFMFINDYGNAKLCFRMSLKYKRDLINILYYVLLKMPSSAVNFVKRLPLAKVLNRCTRG